VFILWLVVALVLFISVSLAIGFAIAGER